MRNKVTVSICMLAYNHEDYIRQAIDGVLMQKCNFHFELIIGEDGSTDSTRQICIEYKQKYPNIIQLLLPSENQGMYVNWITCISAVQGKYLAFCEGDDYWTDPYKLQKQVDFIEANLDYGMIHTDFAILNESEQYLSNVSLKRHSGYIFEKMLQFNEVGTLTVLLRSDLVFEAINDNVLKHYYKMIDYPLWLYIASKTKVYYWDECTSVYRVLLESASNSQDSHKKQLFVMSIMDIRYEFAKKNNSIEIIKDQLIDSRKGNLNFAFHNNLPILASASYLFLLKNKKQSLRDSIYYCATKSILFGSLLKLFIILKKKIV